MRKLIVSASILLAACGAETFSGHENGIDFRCNNTDGFDGYARARIDLDCVECDVQNERNVNDSSIRTAADVTVPLTSPEMQGAGIMIGHGFFSQQYEAGSEAGAFITYPDNTGGTLASFAVRIRTYNTIDGVEVQQEAAQVGADVSGGALERELTRQDLPVSDPAFPHTFVHFTTKKSFDAVEIQLSATGLHGGPVVTRVFALCTDASASY
jgi:hypothetical protein